MVLPPDNTICENSTRRKSMSAFITDFTRQSCTPGIIKIIERMRIIYEHCEHIVSTLVLVSYNASLIISSVYLCTHCLSFQDGRESPVLGTLPVQSIHITTQYIYKSDQLDIPTITICCISYHSRNIRAKTHHTNLNVGSIRQLVLRLLQRSCTLLRLGIEGDKAAVLLHLHSHVVELIDKRRKK